MDRGTRDLPDAAALPVAARSGQLGAWARLNRPTRRSLVLCGAVAALYAALIGPVEWWLAEGYWDWSGWTLGFVLVWLVAPMAGGLLLGWPWVRVYGLFQAGASAAMFAAEGATRWDAWAQIAVLVAALAAAGAVL